MTDQKNGQEYLSFVLEKLQARLAEISQSLLDGQKEIENMHPDLLLIAVRSKMKETAS